MEKIIDALIPYLPLWYILSIAFFYLGFRFYYTRFKPLEDRTKHADCKNKNQELAKLTKDMEEVKQDIQNIKLNLVEIKTFLQTKHKQPFDTFGMKNSPRKLNPNGEQLLSDIKGVDFLKEHKDYFFAFIDAQKPKTAYDVEVEANSACMSSVNEEIFLGMKKYVYNAPLMELKDEDGNVSKYEVTLPDVCFVLSIPLRDMYLKEHPEISED